MFSFVIMLSAQLANAAGMEGIRVHSLLGQPLRAEISVSASKEEQSSMTARLASPEQFSRAGLSYSSEHGALRLLLEKRGENSVIVIRSAEPINEPYLDLLVELSWQAGHLVRGYTALLDPPEVASQILYQPATVTPPVGSSSVAAEPAEPLPPQESVAQPQEPVGRPQESVAQPREHATQPQEPIAQPQEPVAQPQQPVTPESGASDAEHVVKKGDNLHRIARANQLPGVSLEQMIVALYRNNPAAFSGNNMNRLKQGVVLRLAGETEASATSQQEAKQVIRTQTAAWNQYRRALASYAGSTNVVADEGGRSVSGTVSARVEEKLPPAEEGRDKVRVSRSDQSKGSAGVSEEDLIAQDKRLQESKDRVAQLEKIVADLQKLLDLREQSLRELQKQQSTSSAKGEKPKTGRSGKPSASLNHEFSIGQVEGQVFSTINAYRVAV
jgi:pilus assembly protein FimV